jgi:hypothetical protein
MQGTRLHTVHLAELVPGAYGKTGDTWLVCTPNGALAVLNAGHQVTEHEDGTITVSPSILVSRDPDQPRWHGYLERGVWRTLPDSEPMIRQTDEVL